MTFLGGADAGEEASNAHPIQKFCHVSALVYSKLYKVTKEQTFEKVGLGLAKDEMQGLQRSCHVIQPLCLVPHQMQDQEEEEEALCCRRSSLGRARLASPPHALQEHPHGHEDALHEHASLHEHARQPVSHVPHPMLTKNINFQK